MSVADQGEPSRPRQEPRATHHRLEVPRTARYLTLGPADAEEAWVVLHGYGQLAHRFLRRFAVLDDGSRRVVAPEALSRFYVRQEPGRHGPQSVVGGTWMTRESREDEIRDYVRYLDLLAERELRHARRVTVLGFSQGVATAARWVVSGTVEPARLILWGDFLPPDLDVERARVRLNGTAVVLVRGSGDGTLEQEPPDSDEEALLATLDLAPRRVVYAGGHDIDPDVLLSLADQPG